MVAEIGGQRLVRDLFPANGGTGLGPAQLHLGLGESRNVDRLSLRWPSGKSQEFTDLPANSRVTLIEGREGFRAEPLGGS